MNGTLLESLPSASRISGNGDLRVIVKLLSSTARIFPDRLHQLLAQCIALAPAFDRGDAIDGANRLPVMPFQAGTQRKAVSQLVVADRPAVDHLRLRLEILVERKQRVEDEVAKIACHIGCRPDRIDAAQIGLRDEAQGRRPGLRLARTGDQSEGECCRGSRHSKYAGKRAHRFSLFEAWL